MGNASGKDGENGPGGPSARSDGMGSSPPESPGRSRSPFVFTPQVHDLSLGRAASFGDFFCFVSAVFVVSWAKNAHHSLLII